MRRRVWAPVLGSSNARGSDELNRDEFRSPFPTLVGGSLIISFKGTVTFECAKRVGKLGSPTKRRTMVSCVHPLGRLYRSGQVIQGITRSQIKNAG